MNNRDRDLILDLVEGRLSAEAADAAMSRVQASHELSQELAEQTRVHTTLSEVEPMRLTGDERNTLRANLIAELHLESATTAPHHQSKKQRWWLPVAGLAATAAVVTAIVVLPNASDDSATIGAIQGAETSRTETPSLGAPPAADEVTESDQTYEAGDQIDVIGMENIDPDELLHALSGESDKEAVQDVLERLGYKSGVVIDRSALDNCRDELIDHLTGDATSALILGADQDGGKTIVHFGITTASGIDQVVSVDLTDCSVVDNTD